MVYSNSSIFPVSSLRSVILSGMLRGFQIWYSVHSNVVHVWHASRMSESSLQVLTWVPSTSPQPFADRWIEEVILILAVTCVSEPCSFILSSSYRNKGFHYSPCECNLKLKLLQRTIHTLLRHSENIVIFKYNALYCCRILIIFIWLISIVFL